MYVPVNNLAGTLTKPLLVTWLSIPRVYIYCHMAWHHADMSKSDLRVTPIGFDRIECMCIRVWFTR